MSFEERLSALEAVVAQLTGTTDNDYVPSGAALTIAAAASELNRTEAALYAAISRGSLKAQKIFGIWYIEPEDLEVYRQKSARRAADRWAKRPIN